jgi:hypothetical protein
MKKKKKKKKGDVQSMRPFRSTRNPFIQTINNRKLASAIFLGACKPSELVRSSSPGTLDLPACNPNLIDRYLGVSRMPSQVYVPF